MTEYLPISEARQRFLRLELHGEDEVVVTRNGRPVFTIVSHERSEHLRKLEGLVETAEILADHEFMTRLRDVIDNPGETVSWEEAKKELDL
jgi:prevent-host-death family protein